LRFTFAKKENTKFYSICTQKAAFDVGEEATEEVSANLMLFNLKASFSENDTSSEEAKNNSATAKIAVNLIRLALSASLQPLSRKMKLNEQKTREREREMCKLT
jgi:hypothetical protein